MRVKVYKYLGVLETDKSLGEEMKLTVSKVYFRRLKKRFWGQSWMMGN